MLCEAAYELGYRMERTDVHCNMCGEIHRKWSLTQHGEILSFHPTQADALDRLAFLCSTH